MNYPPAIQGLGSQIRTTATLVPKAAKMMSTPSGRQRLKSAIKKRATATNDIPWYPDWITRNETILSSDEISLSLAFQPTISIVTPVYNVEEVWLRKFVESVQQQTYQNWELCLADDHSPAPHIRPLLQRLAAEDSRIKITFREENGGISAATNSALTLATGEYIGFADNDDELAPSALMRIVEELNNDRTIDFFYTDEDKITENNERFDPFFKPDFNPLLLLGHNYITHFVVVSRELLEIAGPLRSIFNGSQDYDFVLRATENAKKIKHIPEILYHWRTLTSSVAGDPHSKMYAYEAGKKTLEAALERRNIAGDVHMLDNLGTYKINIQTDNPTVTVITCGYSPQDLAKLEQLTANTSVSFVNVDNAKKINRAASQTSSDILVFLRDVLPQNSTWLTELINPLMLKNNGVVGGKIYDYQQRLLNIGVTLRALRTKRPFEMFEKHEEGIGYYFRSVLPRNIFAVTEDCMAVSRELFEHLGGFNAQLQPSLQGIEFCGRVHMQTQYDVGWTPYAVFTATRSYSCAIDEENVWDYLRGIYNLSDPYASRYFPGESDASSILYSVDDVKFDTHSQALVVTGWGFDSSNLSLVDVDVPEGYRITKITRTHRYDLAHRFALPPHKKCGFVIEIEPREDLAEPLKTIDIIGLSGRISVSISPNSLAHKIKHNPVLRRAALIKHPRLFYRAVVNKLITSPQQERAYQKRIHHVENYDLDQVRNEISQFSYQPLISILIPVYNVEPKWLKKCIDSIRNQYYSNWEICFADDASTDPRVRIVLDHAAAKDSRINVVYRSQNGHISRATNSALDIATGDFIALMDNDDELPPHALYEVVQALNADPSIDMIYSDEDKINENGKRFDPHFKPDYSPDLFLSTNYISHLGVYRTCIAREIGGFRTGYEGAQDYDFALRFTERIDPSAIKHIPHVLYHWRTLPTSTASGGEVKSYASDAGLRAVKSAVERRGLDAEVVPEEPNGIYTVRYALNEEPLVSIIIPTKNGYQNVQRCVDSLLYTTAYKNFEIILADNGSINPYMFRLYEHYQKLLGKRFILTNIDIPFNYSTINNRAVNEAHGDYLLFLNDDTQAINPMWLTYMVAICQQERIGMVGAKLLYPNNTIQHAGVVLGLGGVAGHISVGQPRNAFGYFGRLIENVNYSAVTAACALVKRTDFLTVGGFDEELSVAYNDVDLSLRIKLLGKDNVWVHEAMLYHFESVTRGYDTENTEKLARLRRESDLMRSRYPQLIDDDPYFNPNLSLDSGNYEIRS